MNLDDQFYQQAGNEVDSQKVISVTMTRAFSDALGDKDKAIALYIKYRVQQLRDEHEAREKGRLEEERRIEAKTQEDRSVMKLRFMTVCRRCGYAGAMKDSWLSGDNHTALARVAKCPKCKHRFDWYYVPSAEIAKQRENQEPSQLPRTPVQGGTDHEMDKWVAACVKGSSKSGNPIRGWLFLVAAWMVLALLVNSYNIKVLTQQTGWSLVWRSDPITIFAVIFEFAFRAYMCVLSIWLAMLFFSKKSTFPKMLIFYVASVVILGAVNASITACVPKITTQYISQAWGVPFSMFIWGLIWAPYFLKSKRVKMTFVDGNESAQQSLASPPNIVSKRADAWSISAIVLFLPAVFIGFVIFLFLRSPTYTRRAPSASTPVHVRTSSQSKQEAVDAKVFSSIEEEAVRILNEARLPASVERSPATTPKATGELGEIERYLKDHMDRIVIQRNDLFRELTSAGWYTLLDAHRIKKDTTMSESKLIIERTKAILDKYESLAAKHIKDSRTRIGALHLSDATKKAMLAGDATGFGQDAVNEIFRLHRQTILQYESIVQLLASSKGWKVEDDEIAIDNDEERARFNSCLLKIQQIGQQEERIRTNTIVELNRLLGPIENGVAASTATQRINSLADQAAIAAPGDAADQYNLGIRYARGQGVPQDYAEAVKWIRKAAEQGYTKAQCSLGFSYHKGQGVPTDYIEAAKWYRMAADQGDSEAQCDLGFCYANGQGVPQDYAEALKLYRKAAEQGFAEAQSNIGFCYANGQGVHQDDVEALKWFRTAADRGNASAQHNLGACYSAGQGVPQDHAEAAKWYRKAAEQGNAESQFNLGVCSEKARGVPQDFAEAAKWYRRAADQGKVRAQYNLGVCYANGQGVSKDCEEAARWYRKAAEQGQAEAQSNLGVYYIQGRGVPQDFTEAAKWFLKAATQGDVAGQLNIGLCYVDGLGVIENPKTACGWFLLASAAGQKQATREFQQVASKLSSSEVGEARDWASRWKPIPTALPVPTMKMLLLGEPNETAEGNLSNAVGPAPQSSSSIEIGDSMSKVIAVRGQPASQETVGQKDIFTYYNGSVTFRNGKVVSLVFMSDADVQAKARRMNNNVDLE